MLVNTRSTTRLNALATAAFLGAAVALGGFLVQPLSAGIACEDVSGTYEVLVDLPGGGPTNVDLELEQNECELTGYVGLRLRTPIENGVVEESTASFTFAAQNQGSGGTLEIAWEITVDGDDVTGTFSHELFGSREVTGSRVAG